MRPTRYASGTASPRPSPGFTSIWSERVRVGGDRMARLWPLLLCHPARAERVEGSALGSETLRRRGRRVVHTGPTEEPESTEGWEHWERTKSTRSTAHSGSSTSRRRTAPLHPRPQQCCLGSGGEISPPSPVCS